MTETDSTRTRDVAAGTANVAPRRPAARERRLSLRGSVLVGLGSGAVTAGVDDAVSLRRSERANRFGDDGGRSRRADSGAKP